MVLRKGICRGGLEALKALRKKWAANEREALVRGIVGPYVKLEPRHNTFFPAAINVYAKKNSNPRRVEALIISDALVISDSEGAAILNAIDRAGNIYLFYKRKWRFIGRETDKFKE